MEVGRDIYRISVPMTGGVLAAAMIFKYLAHSPQSGFTGAAIIQAAVFMGFAAVLMHERASRSNLAWVLMFFSLGAFCYSSRLLCLPYIPQWNPLGSVSQALRQAISAIPFHSRDSNALVSAIIIGDRSGLSASIRNDFAGAGAAHLLALSGMHLGIIYSMLIGIMKAMGNTLTARKVKSVIVIILTGAYSMMCGAGPSLMRAWLFILLNEGAKILGRPQPISQIYCSALFIHLVFHPEAITSLGFQLSYLAMTGIVFVWPHVKGWMESRVWELASLSICCQLFTAPLTYHHFGTFPKFFLITNLVCAPLMAVVMPCGMISIALSVIFGSKSELIVTILEYPIQILLQLLHIISTM